MFQETGGKLFQHQNKESESTLSKMSWVNGDFVKKYCKFVDYFCV